jgi:hypothetical protein
MRKAYKHLFFDLDKTIAPPRQPIVDEMYALLSSFPHDIVIVSGQDVEKIKWQSNALKSTRLGQNGNHATEHDGTVLWNIPLEDQHREEIHAHIKAICAILDHEIHHEWTPIEDRGSQITFSPIGNTAPIDVKMAYDPNRTKREELLKRIPFVSRELTVKIGGSTSFDYIHKNRHKGTNVQRLITYKGWDPDACIYYGDGLFPGGNDEAVIGVIETVLVTDHNDTLQKLQSLL